MKQLRVLWLKSVQREVIETRIIASVKGEFFNYDSNSCLKFSSSIDAVEVSCINLLQLSPNFKMIPKINFRYVFN